MWDYLIKDIWKIFGGPYYWLDKFFEAIPGAWETYLTMFTMFSITRFLMGAIMGSAFGAGVFKLVRSRGSDRARRKDD